MKNPRQNNCCGEHCVRNSHRGNHDSLTPFYSIRAGYCQLGRTSLLTCLSSPHWVYATQRSKSPPGDHREPFGASRCASNNVPLTKPVPFLFQRVLSAPPCAKASHGPCRRCRCI